MSITPQRAVAVLTELRKSIEPQAGDSPTRSASEPGQSIEALTIAIDMLSEQSARRSPAPDPRLRMLEPLPSAAAALIAIKRFLRRRRQRRAPRLDPQLIPATKRHEPLIRALWNVPLGEALALLPVSYNGKHGRARRHYFVVRRVERFLDSLPTL